MTNSTVPVGIIKAAWGSTLIESWLSAEVHASRPDLVARAAVIANDPANDPVAVGSAVNTSVAFSDINTSDAHSAQWSWGDASAASSGSVTESIGAGSASGSHVFGSAGVYKVSVTVTESPP